MKCIALDLRSVFIHNATSVGPTSTSFTPLINNVQYNTCTALTLCPAVYLNAKQALTIKHEKNYTFDSSIES